jgi:hypothetical protein
VKTCTVLSNVDGPRDWHNGKDYEACAIRLAKSIRKNGGSCKDIPIVFWYPRSNKPSEETINTLLFNGCTVIGDKCSIDDDALYCKISACKNELKSDYTLYLDTDSYVMGDFSRIFDINTDVSLMPAQWSYEGYCREEDMEVVDKLYEAYGCTRDKTLMTVSQVDKKPCNFYFYSSAIVYKNGIGFGDKYEEAARAVLSSGLHLPDGHLPIVIGQVTLGMIVQKYKLTHSTIPLDMYWNLNAHGYLPDGTAIVHYQDKNVWDTKYVNRLV